MLIRVAKGTLKVALVAATLVVLAFAAFHIMLARLPKYEGEIAAWIDARFGVRLAFSSLDARWGLEGPELTLRDASVTAPAQAAPFFTAREVRVGVSPFALLARFVSQRELGIERLTFEGTALAVVRTADGELRLQGGPDTSAAEIRFEFAVPPNVDVRIRDSRLAYVDAARDTAWNFSDVTATLRRVDSTLELEAAATPPAFLGQSVELDAQGVIAGDGSFDARAEWRAAVDVAALDLAAAAKIIPALDGHVAGRGDVALWLTFGDGALATATLRAALADAALTGGAEGTAPARYERAALTADWQARADGWRVIVNDLTIERGGRAWPAAMRAEIAVTGAPGARRVELATTFLRLEDVTPFVALFGSGELAEAWAALAPRGDARDVALTIADGTGGRDYALAARFAALALQPYAGLPAVAGLAGEVRADTRSGRLVLEAGTATLAAHDLFRAPLAAAELAGTIVWREGQDALRVVADELVAATPDFAARTSFELTLPRDGSSAVIDLTAAVGPFDVAAVPRYLPVGKMPPAVVRWLDGALRGGRAAGAQVKLFGPLAAFPFDGGEGELKVVVPVADGVLAFVPDWPAAEDLDGTLEFVNASFAARGSGRLLGNRTADVRVGIEDMRRAVVTVDGETRGPLAEVLAFLNGAPLIARYLGPDFARLTAPAGTGAVTLDLDLPLADLSTFTIDAALTIADGELAYEGFGPRASEVRGTIEVEDGRVGGEGLTAIFLDGPVTASVAPAEVPGYRTQVTFEGEVAAESVTSAFALPYADLVRGQTRWRGDLLIPSPDARAPARITVETNLSGIASRFPAPFAKAPSEATNVQVAFEYAAAGGLAIDGHWGAARRFALEFDAASPSRPGAPALGPAPPASSSRFALRRAAVRFGGELPALDFERGVRVDGSLPVLALDDWLTLLRRDGGAPQLGTAFAGAALSVDNFSAFGQSLGATRVDVRRRTSDWQLDVDSVPVAGTVLVPADLDADPQIVAVMRRLFLRGGGETRDLQSVDPRALPGLQLHADDFALGTRRLGRLDAEVLSEPDGLRLVSFESESPSFTAKGSGAWLATENGPTSRMTVTLASTDVAATLDELGFDPIVAAESAAVTTSVFWPGAPAGDWLAHLGGELSLLVKKGTLTDVAPGGAGRMAGLLSFSALPRRLALDFRDVVARGFAFDEITADFVLVDGNAYTDDLKLTGPTAEIGIIGRTGLRDRDYAQQAIVTAEPGKMLPTVGLLGGPGVAAALFVFTRIFKEPLKGIGRASYCVTGSWHEPAVARLEDGQLEAGAICAELPPGMSAAADAETSATANAGGAVNAREQQGGAANEE